MKKILACVVLILIANTAVLAKVNKAPKAPFKVVSYDYFVLIQALDDVTLWEVKFNKGKCKAQNNILYESEVTNKLSELRAGKNVNIDGWKHRLSGTTLVRNYVAYEEDMGDFHMKYSEVREIVTNCKGISEIELITDTKTWKINVRK